MLNISSTDNIELASVTNPVAYRYQATPEAAEWCIEQQLVHFNNTDVYLVFFVFLAYMLLSLAAWLQNTKWHDRYFTLVMWARTLLLIYFLAWLIIFKFKLFPIGVA